MSKTSSRSRDGITPILMKPVHSPHIGKLQPHNLLIQIPIKSGTPDEGSIELFIGKNLKLNTYICNKYVLLESNQTYSNAERVRQPKAASRAQQRNY